MSLEKRIYEKQYKYLMNYDDAKDLVIKDLIVEEKKKFVALSKKYPTGSKKLQERNEKYMRSQNKWDNDPMNQLRYWMMCADSSMAQSFEEG